MSRGIKATIDRCMYRPTSRWFKQ